MAKIDLKEQVFLVFDVESVGLHGPTFAVGWVLKHINGEELDYRCYAIDLRDVYNEHRNKPDHAHLTSGLNWWTKKHYAVLMDSMWPNDRLHISERDMRLSFWQEYRQYLKQYPNLLLAADVPWPVKANFLTACIRDNLPDREWQGPYPILDIASVLAAKGLDPLQKFDRYPDELPEHNPLADARQSARVLVDTLLDK
jgi:hypothetical protein